MWQSVDPVLEDLLENKRHSEFTRKLAVYSYGLNNPVRLSDPDGNDPKDWVIGLNRDLEDYGDYRYDLARKYDSAIVKGLNYTEGTLAHIIAFFIPDDDAELFVALVTLDLSTPIIKGYKESPKLLTGISNALKNLFKAGTSVMKSDPVRLHHSWAKYLGGAEKQDLVPLPKSVHDAYHSGLDKILPRQRGTAYFDSLTGKAKEQMYRDLIDYTKAFDAKYGTKLYDAMIKNGLPDQ
jgi:hypothetical protein